MSLQTDIFCPIMLFLCFLDAPKKVTLSQIYMKAKEGTDVQIECSSKANPNATFKWINTNLSTFSQEGNVLNLPSIQPHDSGEYHCEASNTHGHESDKIIIDVLCMLT